MKESEPAQTDKLSQIKKIILLCQCGHTNRGWAALPAMEATTKML